MESPAPIRFDRGAIVIASDGDVGTVDETVTDPATGEPSLLGVRLADGRRVEVPFAMVDAASSDAGQVRLLADRAMVSEGAAPSGREAALGTRPDGGDIDAGDRIVIPRHEEVLVPSTREVEIGTVRIHKRVETVPYEGMVDVTRDDLTVERVPIGRPVAAVPAPRHEGNTLVIPVVEEEIVTEKRLVLREEIRVTRRQVTEQVPISDTLRREVVEVEDPTGGQYRATSGALGTSSAAMAVETDPVDDRPLT